MGSVQCVLSAVPAGETRGGFNERALPIERSATTGSISGSSSSNLPWLVAFLPQPQRGSAWRAARRLLSSGVRVRRQLILRRVGRCASFLAGFDGAVNLRVARLGCQQALL